MDFAAHEGEALSAAEKFIALIRRDRVSFPDFVGHLAQHYLAIIPAAPAAAPPSVNVRVNFGKYRGMTLGEIAEEDIGYVAWLATNHSQPWIRDAAEIVLDFYGGQHQ